MAPQISIPVSANIIGTIGTVFGASKIWHNWRHKKTNGLPSMMMFLWALSGVPMGVYAIVQNFNVPLQLQPQIFAALCLISWGQILIYHNHWKPWKATTIVVGTIVLFGGLETILVLTLRGPYDHGTEYPIIINGVVAAVLMAVGYLPTYYEIWTRHGKVLGINFVFLTLDWMGAFLSLMALVAQHTFDVLGGTIYILCLFFETGIFTCHGLWLFQKRRMERSELRSSETVASANTNIEMGLVRSRRLAAVL